MPPAMVGRTPWSARVPLDLLLANEISFHQTKQAGEGVGCGPGVRPTGLECLSPMTDLAIVHCRQLVPLAGPPGARSGAAMRSLAIIADGALRIRGGRIAAVGPRAEIERSLSEDTADR